jgi:hypothetical protein
MTTTAEPAPTRPPIVLWSALATLLTAAWEWSRNPTRLWTSLGDTDDATRLIEVRAWMHGAAWGDMTLPAFGGDHPLVSHWSRLIDVPLRALLTAFDAVLPSAAAVVALRVLWPKLVLFALLVVLAREAWRRAGAAAAGLVILLTIGSSSALLQYTIGRIDHHNVQILCAVAGALWIGAAFRDPRAGAWGGAALGLGTAIGYEGLPLTAATLGLSGALALFTGRGAAGVSRAAGAYALTLAVAFAITVAPQRWSELHCDALSGNLVLLAGIVSPALMVVLGRMAAVPLALRVLTLSVALTAALALYVAVEPACLGGPFGQVNPAVKPIWMDHVMETKSILALFDLMPAAALSFLLHVAVALVAATLTWRARRDDASLLTLAVLGVGVLLSVLQLKLMAYAATLALLPIAVWIATLEATPSVSAPVVRAIAFVLLNQTTLFAMSNVAPHKPTDKKLSSGLAAVVKCTSTPSVSALATLPEGLAVVDLTLGPYVAALTPLRVLAAPYHRIDAQILQTDSIFRGPPDKARGRLTEEHAQYVILCEGVVADDTPADSLRVALTRGEAPDFLEPVPLPTDTPLKVWRVKP